MNIDYGVYQALVDDKCRLLFYTIKSTCNQHDIHTVQLAYNIANHSHSLQKRKSGEPYIIHPIEVATMIASWGLDAATIAASLLHDVVEDTSVTHDDIEQIFGHEIAELVFGVTKLEKINFASKEIAYAEYFRKIVLAMVKDIRVILIKLADRLHNMLTLDFMSSAKKYAIALETMEIYVPIANKIGLHKVYLQLADESFKYLYPYRYKVLFNAINKTHQLRIPILETILNNIRGGLKSNGVEATFICTKRAVYNLYKRMLRRNQKFKNIHDVFEIKIIVNSIKNCYLTLGVLHNLYQPLPGKFKDYIAIPKSNGYQSLHSTLMGPHGIPIQIHIRTNNMEAIAEYGVISHGFNNQQNNESISANQRTSNWINNIVDIQKSTLSANEFLLNIKQDLSPIDIYLFTPKGKIIILPKGSTPIDFAYFIHTDLGNHCMGAKINSKVVKLNTKLQNGDMVEIIASNDVEPNSEWLEFVTTGRAMSKIKQYLKEQKYDEDVNRGENLINYSIEALGSNIVVNESLLAFMITTIYHKLTPTDLLYNVGIGNISALIIAKHILQLDAQLPIIIKLSNCHNLKITQDMSCLALPNDSVFIHINRNYEIIMHAINCKNYKNYYGNNHITAVIINDIGKIFFTKIHITIKNIPGTFNQFSGIIANQNINIIELSQESFTNEVASIKLILGVFNSNQIKSLCALFDTLDYIQTVQII